MLTIRNHKFIALLLCFVMIATSVVQFAAPAAVHAAENTDLTILEWDPELEEGYEIEDTFITEGGETTLKVEGATGDIQWQFYAEEVDTWVSIYGETEETILLKYAKVANMLNDKDKTQIRCIQTNGDTVTESTSIDFEVKAAEEAWTFPAAGRETTEEIEYTITDEGSVEINSEDANAGIALAAEENVKDTYNVVINYVFENNQIVADPYTANLEEGTNFSATVTFPTVQGYLPYLDEVQKNSLQLNITGITADITYNVVYKPTNVNYTVLHYLQNVDNDEYTLDTTETLQGLTGSTVSEGNNPEIANESEYAGFYALLYEKPTIAADGSTVVEVYYDRNYYLMFFEMGEDAYGTEPIYARYGTEIKDVKNPTRAGYTFKGWSLDGTTVVNLPETMPAENTTYKAIWEADATAKVTVVFWGENADDEEYSYIQSSTVNVKPGTSFTFNPNGQLICSLDEHSHSAACGYSCGKEIHSHTLADCYELDCDLTSHNHQDEGCQLSCDIVPHEHSTSCYSGVGSSRSPATGMPDGTVSEGYVHNHWYYDELIYINGRWYEYSGSTSAGNIAPTICNNTANNHTHSDSCYACGKVQTDHAHSIENGCYDLVCQVQEHNHSAACGYACGDIEHSHSTECYMSGAGLDNNLWTFVRSETVTVAADGSSVINVYYDRTTFTLTFRSGNSTVATITDKWGAEISDEFEKAPFNTTYNGRAWECTDGSKYGYALQTLDRMPKFNATFNLYSKSSNTLKTIYYYVENVGTNASENSWPSNTSGFTKLKEVDTYFTYATYEEEYHEIEGYTRYSRSIAGFNSNNRKDFSNNTLYLYYLRNDYTLTFNDGYEDVKTETVQYEAALEVYDDFTPEVPVAYEPGSVQFAGWYQNPQCTGEEFKLDENVMPLGNLILYAKWVPVNHTVEFYLDELAYDANTKLTSHPDITVAHGATITPVPAEPDNGDYEFVGWFYEDENGNEKAFDFANMPITKNMKVYGKWSSNVLKEYTINFKYKDEDGNEHVIADPIEGSALAGFTKTFEAKGGTDLYTDYQAGYFPVTKSHSLVIDINSDDLEYTFWYVQKEAVPYTVRYLIKNADGTTTPAITNEDGTEYIKSVENNRLAVVTETFEVVPGYMPDAYQKRLVVDGTDGAVNEIIFYYSEDTTHAYYKITHWIQNLDGLTYTEYSSLQAVGDIGTRYTGTPIEISGYTYKPEKLAYYVDEVKVTEDITAEGVKLTNQGLEINLYYDRNEYPYEVRYLELGTGKELATPKTGTGKYGQVVSESAIGITDYAVVGDASQTLNIRIEEGTTPALNIITFYYVENEVTINYQVKGPAGCGIVNPTGETVKIQSGTVQGSTAKASSDVYKFVGWYSNEACTDDSFLSADAKYVPEKVDGKNVAATYYAKFEYNLTDLTITKTGVLDVDHDGANIDPDEEGQSTIFVITEGNAVIGEVVIYGNDSVTIKGLTVGRTYKVREKTDWSWRYEPGPENEETGERPITQSITLKPVGNIVTFDNERTNEYWLNGGTYESNLFSKSGF